MNPHSPDLTWGVVTIAGNHMNIWKSSYSTRSWWATSALLSTLERRMQQTRFWGMWHPLARNFWPGHHKWKNLWHRRKPTRETRNKKQKSIVHIVSSHRCTTVSISNYRVPFIQDILHIQHCLCTSLNCSLKFNALTAQFLWANWILYKERNTLHMTIRIVKRYYIVAKCICITKDSHSTLQVC